MARFLFPLEFPFLGSDMLVDRLLYASFITFLNPCFLAWKSSALKALLWTSNCLPDPSIGAHWPCLLFSAVITASLAPDLQATFTSSSHDEMTVESSSVPFWNDDFLAISCF